MLSEPPGELTGIHATGFRLTQYDCCIGRFNSYIGRYKGAVGTHFNERAHAARGAERRGSLFYHADGVVFSKKAYRHGAYGTFSGKNSRTASQSLPLGIFERITHVYNRITTVGPGCRLRQI